MFRRIVFTIRITASAIINSAIEVPINCKIGTNRMDNSGHRVSIFGYTLTTSNTNSTARVEKNDIDKDFDRPLFHFMGEDDSA